MENLIYNYKHQEPLIWENVQSVSKEKIIDYENLNCNLPNSNLQNSNENLSELLSKVAIIKLNGGLGTSMGCSGPKSMIKVKNNLSFLEIILNNSNKINEKNKVNIPLIFMNSKNTDFHTKEVLGRQSNVYHFQQNYYPRLDENLKPLKTQFNEKEMEYWYPPGHGDIYNALKSSDVWEKLKEKGIEYLFISNSDNLGASFDEKILQYMSNNSVDFLMEVVQKTQADVKGGALIEYNNMINLLEVAQVPESKLQEFYNITKFKYFNTNNIWIRVDKVNEKLNMDVIYNSKKLSDSTPVVQLEMAMGSAIKNFEKSVLLNVPRTRFIPVKKCTDLFLIQSDLYNLDENYVLRYSKPNVNVKIEFSDDYKHVDKFNKAFKNGIPSLLNLESIKVKSFREFTEKELVGNLEF